jgi:hypothetical protein
VSDERASTAARQIARAFSDVLSARDPSVAAHWDTLTEVQKDDLEATFAELLDAGKIRPPSEFKVQGLDQFGEVVSTEAIDLPLTPDAVLHSHGAHTPHVHSAHEYANHQRPIDDETIYQPLEAGKTYRIDMAVSMVPIEVTLDEDPPGTPTEGALWERES